MTVDEGVTLCSVKLETDLTDQLPPLGTLIGVKGDAASLSKPGANLPGRSNEVCSSLNKNVVTVRVVRRKRDKLLSLKTQHKK